MRCALRRGPRFVLTESARARKQKNAVSHGRGLASARQFDGSARGSVGRAKYSPLAASAGTAHVAIVAQFPQSVSGTSRTGTPAHGGWCAAAAVAAAARALERRPPDLARPRRRSARRATRRRRAARPPRA